MMRAFPIGRCCGIQLDVHASWLPIFALVTVTIASAGPIGELGRIAAYVVAALAALVLFASVVAHEVAHAFTARCFGVQTRSIALFLFGGAALLESEPPSPLADAAVALAGPAASAVIAALAYVAMHLVDAIVPVHYGDAAASILAYITVANAALALFNLIPAYPMDGGRVLRAVIWRVRGDRDGATATAALVGIAFGGCFALAGVLAVAATRTWQFVWYVAIAAFLVRSCVVQYRALRREASLSGHSTRRLSAGVSVGARTADQWSG